MQMLKQMAMTLVMMTFAGTANADCQGCASVRAVQEKLRALPSGTSQAPESVLKEAAKAISSLAKKPDTKLKVEQVRELVQLLRLSTPLDFGGYVLDSNTQLIRRNRKAILEEVRRLPAREAGELEEAIEVDQSSEANDFSS